MIGTLGIRRYPATGTFQNSQGVDTYFEAGKIAYGFTKESWQGIDMVEQTVQP